MQFSIRDEDIPDGRPYLNMTSQMDIHVRDKYLSGMWITCPLSRVSHRVVRAGNQTRFFLSLKVCTSSRKNRWEMYLRPSKFLRERREKMHIAPTTRSCDNTPKL